MEPEINLPSHSTAKWIITGVAMLVVGVAVGVLVRTPILSFFTNKTDNSSQVIVESTKKRVEESNFANMPHTINDIRALSVEVVSVVDDNTLKVHTLAILKDQATDERIVTITKDTKIYTLSMKDPKIFNQEMEIFMKQSQEAGATGKVQQPEPFVLASADISNIKKEDMLTVFASENIEAKKEFIASEIRIHPKMKNTTPPQIPSRTK
ncbi:MAG: hypothetical protein UU88_C0015G0032 [Parcubacteria group bacterium GW2011_GWC1_42_11]|uniref:Uncharacterized protein n=1 Tax=Candidatus Nomurabacteria bacterium GW2011_GWC2_42_20 TaxID=1618756 RepID=A0A0G0ZHQ4_9BACT|nr:MAG: hypothetical protein UU88_C0015G0032 [Parcubacteria group bacterium GW2011_GWC1_42_11]KKS48189.1 MAG: hypothetical protein UV12_C0002G0038 [Candidatus Nomurabacteria bacterium GW2011_GWC2_42_20]KKT09764.1 MAG: hypothetical protein UV86_C0002G0007 [Candidatus Nomurabacteria bacterium GW2011_GWB1_43_20]TAN36810.1 MAG: hypothetical protein EPN27_00600 [Patescibacteria group bacterium]HBH71770.1 hypothetical protein [Candidatus Yonathbacteria bacterium]